MPSPSPSRLWLIGGTQESRQLVAALTTISPHPDRPIPSLLVTVTTPAAQGLYPPHPRVTVWVGHLSPDEGDKFIQQQGIGAILDVSHPFATAISQLAIALATRHHLPYLRYERAAGNASGADWRDRCDRPGLVTLPQWADLLTSALLTPTDRTLLTTGTRRLEDLRPWQNRTTLFARVLPQPEAIAAALAAGFTSERLIALRPPVSPEMERALWEQWHITQVVTKASGDPGGEPQKRAIAAQLGVRLVVIERPMVRYPAQTHCLDQALAFAMAT
jgi:precorrin-6A/cobalt-precorrin-6A reductase